MDRLRTVALWIRKPWLPWVIAIACVAVAAGAADKAIDAANNAERSASVARHRGIENRRLIERIEENGKQIEREGRQRRDQTCRGTEGQHRQEIIDLRRAYKFYRTPPPEFASLLQNPLVIQNLREDVRNARHDNDRFGVFVPRYCDEPGVGREEPDPKLPKPPASIRALLR